MKNFFTSPITGFLFFVTLSTTISPASADLLDLLPKPISNQEITIPPHMTSDGNPRIYTDCVETSILRFLQAVLIDTQNPDYVDLNRLIDLKAAPKAVEFFTKYPKIQHRPYYKTPAGRVMRNEWGLMLVQLPNQKMIYVHDDRTEVEANVVNFFYILNDLFPDYHPDLTNLGTAFKSISDYFSSPELLVTFKTLHHYQAPMTEKAGWTYRETLFHVLFNGRPTYEWIYYEYINPQGKTEDAHSEIADLRSPHYRGF